jgi:transposase
MITLDDDTVAAIRRSMAELTVQIDEYIAARYKLARLLVDFGIEDPEPAGKMTITVMTGTSGGGTGRRTPTPPLTPPVSPPPSKAKTGRSQAKTRARPATYRKRPPLEEVARVYNEARAAGRSTTQALIDAFGGTESTVRNWPAAARNAGLLDTPTPNATVTKISDAPSAQPAPKVKGPAQLGGRRPTVDYLEVAKLIAELRAAGANVQDGIAKHYKVPPSTAKNWMARCREQGLVKPLVAGLRVVEDNTVDETKPDVEYNAEAVAEHYRQAVRQNLRQVQYVADQLKIDRSTAMEWIRRARADGALPPAAEPQLPEDERRAMLDSSKPETVA